MSIRPFFIQEGIGEENLRYYNTQITILTHIHISFNSPKFSAAFFPQKIREK